MDSFRPRQMNLWLVRVYAIACALATLPLAPLYFSTLDVARVHPINVADGRRQADGSMVVGSQLVEAMKIGSEDWLPAAAASVGRRLRNLPVGTDLAYRLRQRGGTRVVQGQVSERVSEDGWLGRMVNGLLAIVFTAAGLSLALAARGETTALAGGFLSGAGVALGFAMLEPNAVLISRWPLRNLLIVGVVAVPSGLWAWFLPRLVRNFPKRLATGPLTRVTIAAVGLTAIVRALLTTWAQIPAAFDRLPWRFQLFILRTFDSSLLQTAPFLIGAVITASLLVRQMRSRDRSSLDTRRGDIIGVAFGVGCGVPIAAILVQGVARLATGGLLIPRGDMPLFFLPLLVVPLALTYALLSRRVDNLGVLARRAILFAIAGNSIRALTIAPAALLAVLVYRHREESVRTILAVHPGTSLLAAAAAVGGLRYSDRIHDLVERIFFRERQDARRILRELAEATRRATGIGELLSMITNEIDKALHLESVAVFVHHPATHKLVPPPRTRFQPLDLASTIATVAQRGNEPMDIDLSDKRSPFRHISEMEREWLGAGDFRLLVPFLASDGTVLALLALGEKLSELPFDLEDRLLLGAVAASSALALENQILRSSPPSLRPLGAGGEEPVDDDIELALICPACARIYPQTPAAQCSGDSSTLVRGDVPYILAGKYRFEERIGSGGMGVVYRVRDLSLGRSVAVKTLPRLSSDAAARLRREARAMAGLLHPNVATIFAAESWRGSPMLVFEYLDSGTLATRVRRSRIPVREIVDCGLAMCSGLEEAHRQGILHRDIKPSNVGFTSAGGAKLLDFGLARFLDDPVVRQELAQVAISDEDRQSLSSALSTGLVGTPAYLSPEAIVGEAPHPDFDVWGVAITLYEALTGQNPFFETTVVRTLNRVLSGGLPDVRERRADCPESLAKLLHRALGKDRANRPGTARDLREQLQKL
jgi:hypothetical protein